jgi:hypothetical protein
VLETSPNVVPAVIMAWPSMLDAILKASVSDIPVRQTPTMLTNTSVLRLKSAIK